MRELAVRSALGAGRSRIVRLLLTESAVLSLLGGALGTAVGAAILSAAPSLRPQGLLPRTVTLSFDMRVVAFCAGTALLVGVIPAFNATEFSSAEVIASGSRSVTGAGGRLRAVLTIGEVATAVLLLFGAGLLLRTLMAVDAFDRGYRATSVLSMLLDPLGSRYPTPESLQQFFDQVATEIAAVPGVAGVGFAGGLPLDLFDDGGLSYEIAGDAPLTDAQIMLAMVGVFGILAYSVQQHVRDFGVRRALGATTNDILRLVTANAARVIATGAAIGLVLSAVFGRLIETMLFGVRPLDLATFAFVTIMVGITAAIAIAIAGPAWRAVRIDPATALRNT